MCRLDVIGGSPDVLASTAAAETRASSAAAALSARHKGSGFFFSGFDGQYEGTYKVDGSKLCLTAPAVGQDNTCFDYPNGQKSGDKFKITDPNVGEIEITIK